MSEPEGCRASFCTVVLRLEEVPGTSTDVEAFHSLPFSTELYVTALTVPSSSPVKKRGMVQGEMAIKRNL